MPIINHLIELETEANISVCNITSKIKDLLAATGIQNGQVLIFSRHTTTALVVNEDEPRLLEDIKVFLQRLAPESSHYLHNDLHLRPNIPDDEPMNAHAHLMAITLSTSEVVPIANGNLALGTWQSILLLELDGPRKRTVFCQFSGE